LVAAIEKPINHQGVRRPDRKYSSTDEPAFRR
jgi:hypothetical protein